MSQILISQNCLSQTALLRYLVAASFLVVMPVTPCMGQDQVVEGDGPVMVQLTLPQEVELRVLVDYVSQRLGVKILYDEQIANKRVSVKAPEPIPADTLINLLESALKMKGMALVDADIEGWKRIVLVDGLSQIAVQGEGERIDDFPGTTAITQTFRVSHLPPERIGQIIEPFLTRQGANVITLPDQRVLIVTDYAQNLRRIAKLIETVDQAGPARSLELYQVRHVEASSLAQQISQSLATRAGGQANPIPPADISQDPRTNQLMIVGTEEQIATALGLARLLDVDLGERTEVYAFRYIDAERIDRLVQEIFDPLTIGRLYRSAVDREDNLLIATTTEAVHEKIQWLKREMDVEAKRPGSAVKFYRVKYADAQEILNTLRAIENQGAQGIGNQSQRGVSPVGRGGVGGLAGAVNDTSGTEFVPGPNNPAQPGSPPPTTPAFRDETAPVSPAVAPAGAEALANATIVPGAARVSVDPNTNSIIVIADRAVQQVYADLIQTLDRRRHQVMIEAKVIILDTSDDFALGIELSGGDRSGARRMIEFTSYGLSQVNPVTGSLALIPGRGLNWTLVDPEVADAVLRAVSGHSRARVLSSPRILVNDNATGTLASVSEVPFTSVNASNTVATTSFAGFAEAGTTIEATPRIAEGDFLQLDFNVSLNNFTGTGGDGVPPPRQTDQVVSSVTIPDGYTVIVGGLTRQNSSYRQESVPYLDSIPILRTLLSLQTSTKSQTTLFVFLRPVILRDDTFRDLKFISNKDMSKADTGRNFPKNCPLIIE